MLYRETLSEDRENLLKLVPSVVYSTSRSTDRVELTTRFENHKMETITLNCWVYRDDVENIFPVEIPKNKTVGFLKKVIKDETPEFRDVAAKHLRLHTIRIPGDDDEYLKDELKQLSFEDKPRLNSRTKVSKLFPESDEGEGEWLIVVDEPSSGAPLSMYSVALLMTNIAS